MTPQRLAVLEALRSVSCHPTADELFDSVRRRLPRVSLATVYRNLELLARMGLATAISVPGMPRRFDGDTREHLHVRCERCGRIADAHLRGAVPLPEPPRTVAGFGVRGWHLELVGLCPACRRSSARRGPRGRAERER